MKLFAVGAAAIALLLTTSLGAIASHHSTAAVQSAPSSFTLLLPLADARGQFALRPITFSQGNVPAAQSTTATGTPGTATDTPNPVAVDTNTPTAAPTPTGPAVPDGTTVLQNFALVYTQIKTAHVELLTTAEKPKIEKLTIDGIGNATCKGPAMQLNVTASDVLEGTSQSQKVKATFIQSKNTTEVKTSSKNAKWTKVKSPDAVTVLGFPYPISNPLACPGPVSSGGSSAPSPCTDLSKNVSNLGADSFQGDPTWHIQFTDVRTCTDGTTINFVDDFFIGQQHFQPYILTQSLDDQADGLTIIQKQVTTKIGEKVTIKLHKIGSK